MCARVPSLSVTFNSLQPYGHGISQARIQEWVAISSSRGSSWPRDWACVSCIAYIGWQILYHLGSLIYWILKGKTKSKEEADSEPLSENSWTQRVYTEEKTNPRPVGCIIISLMNQPTSPRDSNVQPRLQLAQKGWWRIHEMTAGDLERRAYTKP